LHEQQGNRGGLADAHLHIATAYQALGRYPKAREHLVVAQRLVVEAGDRARQPGILARIGSIALSTGHTSEADTSLNQALQSAQALGDQPLTATILNDLGNLYYAQQRNADSVKAFEESITVASTTSNHQLIARARINQATPLMALSQHLDAKHQLDQALAELGLTTASHDQAYNLITIGLAYDKLRPSLPAQHAELMTASFETYHRAAEVSESIGDHRAASYAWAYLGRLYETERRYQDALDLTRRAIMSAQQAMAPEALYRWHWQLGRLFSKIGHYPDALGAFRRSVFTLQSVRAELITAAGPMPVAFRESHAGGVYYEFADLLLKRAADVEAHGESEPYLKEARDVIEMLKVDELRTYFGDECVDSARSRIKTLESVAIAAAVIYPIMLPDRLELLVSLPTGLERVGVPIGAAQLTLEIRLFRQLLEKRTTNEYLPHGQTLYQRLIRPIEALLIEHGINTLVFVPDGPLRTIPMAALHDGAEFLIQRYAVATTPGLTLTDPRPLKRETIQALSIGLAESAQGFSALPHVAEEVRAVNQLFGGELLLNEDFLVPRVERELKQQPFSVVHIASHGQFESDPRKSFLLTFDDKLTMDRLDRFIGMTQYRNEPLGLLTLSACETAEGDDRAALGLAGIAIKAGARSALATLWSISDESSSQLVGEFYQQLRDPSVTKATALQRAQRKLLDHPMYRHPAYWAPFLLLNNWL
jgi:CHAT domain-containing protein